MRTMIAALLVLILVLGVASAALLYYRAEQSESEALLAREAASRAIKQVENQDEGVRDADQRAPASSAEAALQAENELLRQQAVELAELLDQIKLELEEAKAADR
jgi:hypothetical protein